MPEKNNIVIGLAGGIGSGKSTAIKFLQKKGYAVVDTDKVSKEIMSEGNACYEMVKAAFPECVIDGVLSRPLLREEIFSNEKSRLLLNSIVHPEIFLQTKKLVAKSGITIIEVPLLFESGFDSMCDATVCVISSKDKRIKRLIKRDNISEQGALKAISSQITQEELKKLCDYIIVNDGNKKELKEAVEKFCIYIQKRFKVDL
jgi:dephospho-CoA kinase